MLPRELGEIYSFVAIVALIIAFVSFYKFGRDTSSLMWKKIFLCSGVLFAIMLMADIVFGIVPPSKTKQAAPPKVETVAEKPKPPEVKKPEESFYAESYDALRQKTNLRVTERWMLDYGERVTPDGNIDTHGFVEFNDDGIKRQFWLVFDGKTRQCLRVKIDSDLIYSAVGW